MIIDVIFSFSSVSLQVRYYAEMVSKKTICIIPTLNIFPFNNFPIVITFSAILNGMVFVVTNPQIIRLFLIIEIDFVCKGTSMKLVPTEIIKCLK